MSALQCKSPLLCTTRPPHEKGTALVLRAHTTKWGHTTYHFAEDHAQQKRLNIVSKKREICRPKSQLSFDELKPQACHFRVGKLWVIYLGRRGYKTVVAVSSIRWRQACRVEKGVEGTGMLV